MTNRFEVDDRNFGLSLAHAIVLANCGDTIVVRTESQKILAEQLLRKNKPNVEIHLVLEPPLES